MNSRLKELHKQRQSYLYADKLSNSERESLRKINDEIRQLERKSKDVEREKSTFPTIDNALHKIRAILPMSKKATAAQLRMWGKVFEVGCIACLMEGNFSFPEIHHVKEYGYRNHDKVYGLCPIHHKATAMVKGVPNRHGTPKEFTEKYGTDQELFEDCQRRLRGKSNG